VRPGGLRRGALLSLVAMGAVALSACGVPIGGAPTVIANSQVNPSALGPPPTTPQQGTPTYIYLVAQSGTPTPVIRLVPPQLCTNYEELLSRLAAGPDPDEEDDGVYSAIPAGTEVLSVTPHNVGTKPTSGPITVDFSDSFGDVGGSEQVLAVEQIVHTIAVLNAQAQVLFEIEGQPIEVPVGTGAQVPRAVSTADYPLQGQQVQTIC
jgi:spore germination protein GerM